MTEHPLPRIVTPGELEGTGLDGLIEHIATCRPRFDELLTAHGAMLFRGFEIREVGEFERFCELFGDELRDYVGGNTPRSKVHGRVYTSTEYPSHLPIPLHNEMSYAPDWPSKLMLFCDIAPTTGGETPLGDSRRILATIETLDPGVRGRFERLGVMYQQNLHGGWGFGKSWQDAFETEDRAAVEAHCREADIAFEWREEGVRLTQVRPATTTHPFTGETVWFNQADQWHVSAHGPKKAARLLDAMQEHELPRHAWYGDGSPIADADLDVVRAAYARVEVVTPWERGDLIVVDNVLTAHGRRPFSGDRRVLVAMA